MKMQRKKYLKIRQEIRQIQSNVRLYLTMGKIFRHRYCQKLVVGLFETCWRVLQEKKAILIQKVWKGYMVRKRFKQAIERMKRNLRLSKIKGKFKRALFVHNYNKFRVALQKYRYPIIKLQAIVRGKFLHRVFKQVKKSTLMIQRVYRRHLKKRFYLQKEWEKFREVMRGNERQKVIDRQRLGLNLQVEMQSGINRVNNIKSGNNNGLNL